MIDRAPELDAGAIISCDDEPIHIPGAIQPHGAMLVLDGDTLEVLQVAGDTAGLLGVSFETLLGGHIGRLLTAVQVEQVQSLAGLSRLTRPRHLLDPILRVVPGCPLDASLYRSGPVLVLEFEAADIADRFTSDPLAGVQTMVNGFAAAQSISDLCQMAADDLRHVIGYDRVMIYQFQDDDSGLVIAESREAELEPFLGLHYPASDIPKQARELYLRNALRVIGRVDDRPAPLVPARNPRTGQPLDMSFALLRDVSPVHRQYLRNMGVAASMSISIILGGRLWGLMACHHGAARQLPRHLRAMCELFGSMFSLQLETRHNGERFEARLAGRDVLQQLMLNLAVAEDYALGLTQESPNLLDYIHGRRDAGDPTQRGGVAVRVKGRTTVLGVAPELGMIEQLAAWLDTHMGESGGVFASDRLGEIWAPGGALRAVASGILVISVSPEQSDYIIWFRPEITTSVTWAGAPSKAVKPGPHGLHLLPRQSFEKWKEIVTGRSAPWTGADRDAAADLRVSLLDVVLRRITMLTEERRQTAARDQLLMAELDHRVKNTLANIQALVATTSRSAESLKGFVQGLDGRIQSMAKAHSLLSQSRWEGVSIEQLMREELEPYMQGANRIVLRGPALLLLPKSALSLSLTVHELVTNAAKFGALRSEAGSIAIEWAHAAEGGFDLSWREAGGPPVTPPTRRGFGSMLIERALAMETGGRASLRFLPAGVVCEMYLPAASVTMATGPAVLPVEPEKADTAARPNGPYRILVVEDSAMIFMGIELVFEMLGWEIVGPATRLDQAMQMARTESFDAAILDVNLNDEMSWPVGTVLRERGVPFIFSTGYDISRMLPLELSDAEVIRKPYQIDEMETRLRALIETRRAG